MSKGSDVRNWFPFSDYDFWGYLASGAILLAGVDYACNAGRLIGEAQWSAAEITLAILAVYLAGHVIASASGLLVEGFIGNSLLRSPNPVLLGFEKRGPIQSTLARLIIGRYYQPLPQSMREKIFAATRRTMGDEATKSADSIFQLAFCKARESEDTRARIDSFRNQYGFCRNLALTCFVVAPLIFAQRNDATSVAIAWSLIGVGVVMLLRFLKFYSHFCAEVLRGLAMLDSK